MDKGIRPHVNAKFLALLPTRVNDRKGNTVFRKAIIADAQEQFGITLASAATHYNHAFIAAREAGKANEDLAKSLDGLGRPEDKKGGRKPKPKAVETPAAEVATGETPPAAAVTDAAAQVGLPEEQPVAKVTVVQKNGKGTAVEFDTLEEAQAYIEANTGQFKAKLVIKD